MRTGYFEAFRVLERASPDYREMERIRAEPDGVVGGPILGHRGAR